MIGNFNSTITRDTTANESSRRHAVAEQRHLNFYPVLVWIIATPFAFYVWVVVLSAYNDIRDKTLGYSAQRHDSHNLIIRQQEKDNREAIYETPRQSYTTESEAVYV